MATDLNSIPSTNPHKTKSGHVIHMFRGRYFFLSNFYQHTFEWNGLDWPTSEHAFQACKFSSAHEKLVVSKLSSASAAKYHGRSVVLPENWENMKLGYMAEILKAKFSALWLQERLAETYPYTLVEGNTWGDQFWSAVWLPRASKPRKKNVWDTNYRTLGQLVGQNELGKLLMGFRDGMR